MFFALRNCSSQRLLMGVSSVCILLKGCYGIDLASGQLALLFSSKCSMVQERCQETALPADLLTQSLPPQTTRRVCQLVASGSFSKACKLLCSRGIATDTPQYGAKPSGYGIQGAIYKAQSFARKLEGNIILKIDFKNAFNSINRTACMLTLETLE